MELPFKFVEYTKLLSGLIATYCEVEPEAIEAGVTKPKTPVDVLRLNILTNAALVPEYRLLPSGEIVKPKGEFDTVNDAVTVPVIDVRDPDVVFLENCVMPG